MEIKGLLNQKKDMYENLDKFLYLLNSEIETNLSVSGRLKNIIPKDHKNLYNRQKSMQCRMVDDYILDLSKNLFYNANFSKTIDANGQIYITNPFAVIPTQLKLNLENKDKLTAKFDKDEYPVLPRKFINNAEDFKMKQIEAKEKMEKSKAKRTAMQIANLDDITNSLLTQNSPEVPKKKNFFEKLFGWLK